ncbi:MAG: UbiX family flavin prenyltransferase [Proteobacteria bacterium]|nr:UbiX family flavin prenyltransferase [Pseudomonadota bacterium]MDA1057062.1 UbiX family flavin prenyltransferase [Pseudomonadota bacterium]
MTPPKKIIVGITGASGAIFGIRLLDVLRAAPDVETHLILSKWGQQTLEHETTKTAKDVRALADVSYGAGEMSAAVSSGSFRTDGMVIVPCSMRTLGCIANGYGDSLVHRAADVVLKERRRLIIVPRETPLSAIHLENMLKLARMGVTILPSDPAFYAHPKTIDDLVDHTVARILDQLDIDSDLIERWAGDMQGADPVVALHTKDT